MTESVNQQGQTVQDTDYYGVVTLEIDFKDIGGIEYMNMLIENSSRICLESKHIVKQSFKTLN